MNLKNIKTAMVRFSVNEFSYSTKQYAFKTDIEDLKEGEIVVCDCSTGITVGVVTQVMNTKSSKATRWIIQKVDLEAYEAKLEKERKLDELVKKMEERTAELTALSQFEILAEKDEQMAELLSEFKLVSRE